LIEPYFTLPVISATINHFIQLSQKVSIIKRFLSTISKITNLQSLSEKMKKTPMKKICSLKEQKKILTKTYSNPIQHKNFKLHATN
jgi:hypothetical protein